MNINLGNTIKLIRENKGLTQAYISDKILTQGNYSKFENLNLDIGGASLIAILNKLELSLEEFLFIKNNFTITERNSIIQKFHSLTYNDRKGLINLLNDIEKYSKRKNDFLIESIEKICNSLLIFIKTKDIENARIGINSIWTHLSKRNHLYISDIYLLNSILFFFPLQIGREIIQYLLRGIDKYKNFKGIEKMKINCLLNFSIFLIKNREYKDALIYIENAISMCKLYKNYSKITVCYIRKGICLNQINRECKSGLFWINKGFNLLKEMDETDLIVQLKDEIERLNYK
ncbi:helix-turn-helix domain-containing protein [Lysinibacillus xylanilyticus]|uniref:helix-turn-helix domain-containing protein n=1 Tax=Lysinibacillus xylanilyticus TaxID=582475 RepID=UPI002B24D192|nr:helix-turn-helix transcriptional regulator [Lysinibacillus xylanilyticus]MEB2301387.1 helix-turn-helix domain-containing protein [Lysinibacillus xylanilyticus]